MSGPAENGIRKEPTPECALGNSPEKESIAELLQQANDRQLKLILKFIQGVIQK